MKKPSISFHRDGFVFNNWKHFLTHYRSSPPYVFLGGVLKICSSLTGEHPCRSVISIKLQSNLIEITLRHECYPLNLLHISRTTFSKNTSGELFLTLFCVYYTANQRKIMKELRTHKI